MRRTLCLLLLLLSSAPLWAAARTASVDGLWSATATWGGLSVPVAGDDCTINSGVVVNMDAASGACGSLTNNGSLLPVVGKVLKIGDGLVGGTSDVITNNGEFSLIAGFRLEFDTDSGAGVTTPARFINAGILDSSGTILVPDLGTRHTSIAVVGVPVGSHPNRTITLTTGLIQGKNDELNGKVLVPTTGWHRWQWFDITTGATDRTQIVVNMDSRGAYDSRGKAGRLTPTAWTQGDWGEIYSTGTATVASGTTTVTFNTAFPSTDRAKEALLGGRFICANLTDDDTEAAVTANVRKFCSVTSTTVAELCTAYSTASCAGGAAFRVFNDNQPPFAAPIPEAFLPGDRFMVIDPAVITIPVANRSDTTQNRHFYMTLNDGSTTRLFGTEIGYCGQEKGGGAGSADCLTVTNIDAASTTEGFAFDLVDLHHWNGGGGIILSNAQNMTLSRFTVRDAAEGGSNDGGEAHGFYIDDPSGNGRTHDVTLQDFRVVRLNDDAFSFTAATESDNRTCDRCTFTRGIMGFAPANRGQSIEAFELAHALTNLVLTENVVTNNFGTLIQVFGNAVAADETSGYIARNVVQNGGAFITCGGSTEGSSITHANQRVTVVGNLFRGSNWVGSPDGSRCRFFNNIFDANSRGTSQWRGIQTMIGNIIHVPNRVPANASYFEYLPSGSNTLLPNPVVFRDNVFVVAPDQPDGFQIAGFGSGASPGNWLVDHNTFYCNDRQFAGTVRATRSNGGAGGTTHTFTNNIYADCETGPWLTAGSQTVTSNYNLYFEILSDNDCTGCTEGANDILSTTASSLGLAAPQVGDVTLLTESTAKTSLGSDGYPRGARVAGVALKTFEQIYPGISAMRDSDGDGDLDQTVFYGVINNVGTKDTDGDGIWDLHDNCKFTQNPDQTDSNTDGIGDACP